VYLAALDNPTGGHRILADQSSVVFVPPSSGTIGHVLFLRDTTLMAQPFDVGTLQSIGDVFPVTGQATFSVTATLRQVAASASGNGVLVYLANRVRDSQLTWFDRSGKALEQVIPSGGQRTVVLSPDGKTAAIGGPQGLSLRDLIRGVDTRFTFPPLIGTAAVWSPDGARLVFSSANTLYVKDASGSGQEDPVFQNANIKLASDWSPDGRFLLYTEIDPKTRADLWILADPLNTTGDHKPVKFLATEFNESMGQFSPDGRWIAYVSDESGQPEVYVRPFPSRSGKWRVSRNRGIQPRWRRDGKELFYMESGRPGHRWMAVPVRPASEGRFEAGEPTMLFAFTTTFTTSLQRNDFVYSPSADGGRFLVNTAVVDASNALLNVITNWEKAAASAAKEP
jgi:Tol biopolymer transport system component